MKKNKNIICHQGTKTQRKKKKSTLLIMFLVIPFLLQLTSCTAIREKHTDRKKIYLDRAFAYEGDKKFRKSLDFLKKAQKEDPNDPLLNHRIATLEKNLKKTVGLNLKKGDALLIRGEKKEAKKKYLLALFLDPGNKDAIDKLRNINFTEPEKSLITRYKNVFWYTVKKDESLSLIAKKFLGNLQKYTILAELNDIKKPYKVLPGQKIRIPKDSSVVYAEPDKKPTEKKESVSIVQPETDSKKPEITAAAPEAVLRKGNIKKIFADAAKSYNEENFAKALEGFNNILESKPDDEETITYAKKINLIIAHLERGAEHKAEGRYIESLDTFHEIMTLKPDSNKARKEINKVLPNMTLTARILINEEQSPCEAKLLINRVLKEDPKDSDAHDLLKKAQALEKGLELQCD